MATVMSMCSISDEYGSIEMVIANSEWYFGYSIAIKVLHVDILQSTQPRNTNGTIRKFLPSVAFKSIIENCVVVSVQCEKNCRWSINGNLKIFPVMIGAGILKKYAYSRSVQLEVLLFKALKYFEI